jgi:hypothetical protein
MTPTISKLSAEKISQMPTLWLAENLKGVFEIVFSDGSSTITTAKETLITSFFWRINRHYNMPILERHHLSSLFGSESIISTDTPLKLFSSIARSVRDFLDHNKFDIRNELLLVAKMGYEAINDLYNFTVEELLEYMSSTNIEDFVEIATNEELMARKQEIRSKLESMDVATASREISALYELTSKVIERDHPKNPIAIAVKSGVMSTSQLMQCVAARGNCTDSDGTIFGKPILDSFTDGIISLADSMMESRSAAIAINNTSANLEDSEYMNRRVQFITMTLQRGHYGDCGSKHTTPFLIRNKKDLKSLNGTYYVVDDKVIRLSSKDEHLIGKTINKRSIFAGCNHPDPAGVCSACMGDIISYTPHGTNIGHALTVPITHDLSQAILGVKHLLSSAILSDITVPAYDLEFIKTVLSKPYYYLNPDISKYKVLSISISKSMIAGEADIFSRIPLDKINSLSVAELDVFEIEYGDENMISSTPIEVKRANRKPSFSLELVRYLRDNQNLVSTTSKGKMQIDMSKWDFNDPLFVMPMRSTNMSDLQKTAEILIESRMSELTHRAYNTKPSEVLTQLMDALSDKFAVSVPNLEAIIYSYMIVDLDKGDYRLPKAGTNAQLSVGRHVIINRSLGPVLAYQGQQAVLLKPSTFLVDNRMDSPLDLLMFPELVKL